MSNKSVEDVQKVLGEPFWADFPANTTKIRRNLLISSFVSLAIVLGGVQIDPTSTLFGLKFTDLSDQLIKTGLSLITAYLFIHFLWCSIDSFIEWRIRVTGTKVAYVTAGQLASEYADYPNDPRQSTLYRWWVAQAKDIGNIHSYVQEIDSKLDTWDNYLEKFIKDGADPNKLSSASSFIHSTRIDMADFKKAIERSQKTIESVRIPASLERFDNWFKILLRSQNLRWITIEMLLPLIVGGYALYALLFL